MKLLDTNQVSRLPRLGIYLPLAFASLWIVGFYAPPVTSLVYSTRWETSVLIGFLSLWIIFRRGGIKSDSYSMLLIFFLVLLAGTAFYSFAPLYTILRSASAALLILSTYFVCRALIKDPDDIKRVFYAFIFLYLALIAVFYTGAATDPYAFASDRLQANQYFKATGGGNMIVSAVLLLLWYYKYCTKWQKAFILTLIVALAISLIMTKSRAPVAGALILWPIGWVIMRGGHLTKGIIGFIIVSISAAAVIYTNPQATGYLRIDTEELEAKGYDISTGRFTRWEFLYEQGKERPVIGHGFGTSRYAHLYWSSVDSSYLEWTEDINSTGVQKLAHNQHVQLFFEIGIFGLLFFWLIIFLLLRRGLRIMRLKASPESLMLKLMFLSVCYHLLDTLSHDGLLTTGNPASYLFWFKVGFIFQGSVVLLASRRRKIAGASTVMQTA